MTYVVQYTILIVILIAAVAYAGRRIYLTWRHSGDKCYGCKGCALHDQILKKQASAHESPRVMRKSETNVWKNKLFTLSLHSQKSIRVPWPIG